MSEILETALTAEEWREAGTIGPNRAKGRYGESKGDHALAALALHGQPFGFTWEDVDTCRAHGVASLAVAKEPHPSDPSRVWWEKARKMDGLADRLAALLPPREG